MGAAATLLVAQEVTSKQTTTLGSDSSRIVTITGEVVKYEPGQFITIESPDHQTVRYTIAQDSQLPQDLAVGKTVTVRTTTVNGAPVARQVTITKITTRSR